MSLDLERFWAVVRPRRHFPRPNPARKPKSLRVHVEAVENAHGRGCTNRIEAILSEVSDGYEGKVHFGVVNSEVTVTGFRFYTGPGDPGSSINCEPLHLVSGDSLILDLHIGTDSVVLSQLRYGGL